MRYNLIRILISTRLFFERKKDADYYQALYAGSYIYKWAETLLIKFKSKEEKG